MRRYEGGGVRFVCSAMRLTMAVLLASSHAALTDDSQAHALLARSDEIRNPGPSR